MCYVKAVGFEGTLDLPLSGTFQQCTMCNRSQLSIQIQFGIFQHHTMCSCPLRPDLSHACAAMSSLKTRMYFIAAVADPGMCFIHLLAIYHIYIYIYIYIYCKHNTSLHPSESATSTWSCLILSSNTPWAADLSIHTHSSLILARCTPCAVALSDLACSMCVWLKV